MSTRIKVAALAALSAAQLASAGWSIAQYESTLASGALHRIRTMPIDPADAFRGRYVAVQPAITVANPIPRDTQDVLDRIQAGEPGYVLLSTGPDGFARVGRLLLDRPRQGDYLRIADVQSAWSRATQPGGQITQTGYNILFSFDRYYMNEEAAPEAQTRYAEAIRRNASTEAWLTVRVKDGVGVIEGLFIDEVPIEKLVRSPPIPSAVLRSKLPQ